MTSGPTSPAASGRRFSALPASGCARGGRVHAPHVHLGGALPDSQPVAPDAPTPSRHDNTRRPEHSECTGPAGAERKEACHEQH